MAERRAQSSSNDWQSACTPHLAMSNDPRSLGEMFADLTRDARMLIQQEIHLAKTELSQSASRLVPGLTMIVAGGLIAFGGLLAVVAAVVLGLIAMGLVAWVAALLGGLVIAGIGYGLVRAGPGSLRAPGSHARQTI